MANIVQHKRSSSAGATPTTSNLAVGEIGINTHDNKLFTNNGSAVVELGGINNVSDDTSPSLGGTLDLNGNSLTQPTGSINLVANGSTTFSVTSAGCGLFDSNTVGYFGGDGSTGGVTLANGYIDIKGKSVSEATYVNFYCESSNAHAVKLQAPAHADFTGNITATLPNVTGTLVTSNAQQRIEVVSALPNSPDANTIYFIT